MQETLAYTDADGSAVIAGQYLSNNSYAVSESQKGLYFIQEAWPDSVGYNIPFAFSIDELVDAPLLQDAFLALTRSFPVLRARFFLDEQSLEIKQCVDHTHFKFIPAFGDSSSENVSREFRELTLTPFNLKKDALIRLHVRYDRPAKKTFFLFVQHHIITDGLSLMILIRSFLKNISLLKDKENLTEEEPDLNFIHFALWETNYLKGSDSKLALAHWQSKLQNIFPITSLPLDHSPQVATRQTGHTLFNIAGIDLHHFKSTARYYKSNPAVLLLACFQVLVYKLTSDSKVSIAMPTICRPKKAYETSVGLYVNNVIVGCQIDNHADFRDVLLQTGKNLIDAVDNGNYPFSKALSQADLGIPTHKARFPLSFNYQMVDERLLAETTVGKSLKILDDVYQPGEYDYCLEAYELSDSLNVYIKYDCSLFFPETIERHLSYLRNIIKSVVGNPYITIQQLNVIGFKEMSRILDLSRGPKIAFPKFSSIGHVIDYWATQSPNNVAVMMNNQNITYAELSDRSNQVASYLISMGVGPHALVGVSMDKSVDLIVTVVGILKAGAAYVPIDKLYPEERINFIIQDSEILFLVTDGKIDFIPKKKVNIIESSQIVLESESSSLRLPAVDDFDVAYVIYTSGSTGKPKGVLVPHSGVMNTIFAQIRTFKISDQDHVSQFASLSFDGSVSEIFMALFSGACLVLIPRDVVDDTDEFIQYLRRTKVSVLTLPPSYLTILPHHKLDFLRVITTGGESANVQQAVECSAFTNYFNGYGPTECSICCSTYLVQKTDSFRKNIPIGRPLPNTQLYVLNNNLDLCPIGIAGELYIGGAGVAHGYLNRLELTSERFISDRFSRKKGARLYRSGDLARWSRDGQLEFLGRIDSQIKLRGYRIELEEIEHVLQQYPLLTNACVTLVENNNHKSLSAFFTAEEKIEDGELQKFLIQRLPEYMVPSQYSQLGEFPLTINGKIDRDKLISIKPTSPRRYRPPETALQKTIASIVGKLLDLRQPVGLNDNFFELGGNSILSIQLVYELNRLAHDRRINVLSVLKNPTVESLSAELEEAVGNSMISPHVISFRNGEGIPIFILPGMPGTSEGYHELASSIPLPGPIYGLQMMGNSQGEKPLSTYQSIAGHYLQNIKNVTTSNVVSLYAHSFGGMVLYELLRQMIADKFSFKEIVIIESVPASDNPGQKHKSLQMFLKHLLAQNLQTQTLSTQWIDDLSVDHWANAKAEIVKRLREFFNQVDIELFDRWWSLLEVSSSISYQYGPQLDARVVCVSAQDGFSKAGTWSKYFRSVIEITSEGDHYSITKNPYCRTWLSKLEKS